MKRKKQFLVFSIISATLQVAEYERILRDRSIRGPEAARPEAALAALNALRSVCNHPGLGKASLSDDIWHRGFIGREGSFLVYWYYKGIDVWIHRFFLS